MPKQLGDEIELVYSIPVYAGFFRLDIQPPTHTHTHKNPTPTPYRTYHPQQTPAQQRPPVEVARLYGDLDIPHYPSCARVNNPTL